MSKKLEWDDFVGKFNARKNRLLGLTDRTNEMFNGSHSIIEIECKRHGKFNAEARRVLNGAFVCNRCAIEYRNGINTKTLDEFVTQSKGLFGDLFSYSNARYVNSYTPITLTCKRHGDFIILPKDHLNKIEGCPLCNMSKLETMLKNKLEKVHVAYIQQKRFDWLGKMSLDFYIPSLSIGIECQGKQHFGYGGWGKNFDFKALFLRDYTKYHLCKDNGVELIYLSDRAYKYDDSLCEIYNNDNLFFNMDVMVENKIKKYN